MIMTKQTLLKVIRAGCIIQFIIVLLYAARNGVAQPEMFVIAASAVFGLLFDGFSHTILRFHGVQKARRDLDIEFDQIIQEMKAQKHADSEKSD